jgi:hypothetical protein
LRLASHFVSSLLFPLHAPSLPRVCRFPSFPFTNPPPWRDALPLRPSWHRLPPSWQLLLAKPRSHVLLSATSSRMAKLSRQRYVPCHPKPTQAFADFLPRRPDSHVYRPSPSMRLPALRLSKTSRSSASSTRPSAISRTPGWATQISPSIL